MPGFVSFEISPIIYAEFAFSGLYLSGPRPTTRKYPIDMRGGLWRPWKCGRIRPGGVDENLEKPGKWLTYLMTLKTAM
jgi:hypothetical protein